MVFGALGIGVLGYHGTEGLPWLDALVNASMILGGMGPVNELHTNAGKLFASAYALFSGLVFVVAMGVLFVPVFHRFLHRFHIGTDEEEGEHLLLHTYERVTKKVQALFGGNVFKRLSDRTH